MVDTMLERVTRLSEYEWEVPAGTVPGMRVPGRFFLSDSLYKSLESGAVQQLANVATLPGIIRYSMGMPDIHWGYGFPIGGVAAFERDTGVISPGGVGFDINCGVRLLSTPLTTGDLDHLYLKKMVARAKCPTLRHPPLLRFCRDRLAVGLDHATPFLAMFKVCLEAVSLVNRPCSSFCHHIFKIANGEL